MAGILSKLFGGGGGEKSGDGGPAGRGDPVEHAGLTIYPAPIKAGSQWRLAGVIVKTGGDDGNLEREYQRADTFSSKDEAESFAISKGKQIIDEQGNRLFANGEKTGRA